MVVVNLEDINIGIDVDGTLTREIIGRNILEELSQSEVERAMLNCTPQNGIDILLENNYKHYIITGREEKYRYATMDWLKMYGIPYRELIMFPKGFYTSNGYGMSKYIDLKVDIHKQKYIQIALDDKEEVIEALNNSGIFACQVKNNFKEAFEKVLILNKKR